MRKFSVANGPAIVIVCHECGQEMPIEMQQALHRSCTIPRKAGIDLGKLNEALVLHAAIEASSYEHSSNP